MDDISNILATGILYGKIFFLPILFIGLITGIKIGQADDE